MKTGWEGGGRQRGFETFARDGRLRGGWEDTRGRAPRARHRSNAVPYRRGSYPRTPSPPRSRRPRAALPWRLRKRTSPRKGARCRCPRDAQETSKPKRAGDDARGGTRRRAFACARECAVSRRRARGRGAVCAPGAPRPRNRVDDRSRQFEFFFSPAILLKTRVDAFKPRRKSHSVIGVLKRTPRTKPPPVWVPLPPAWVIISPPRREASLDGRRRETRETWTAEEKKIFPRASSNLDGRRRPSRARRRRRRRVCLSSPKKSQPSTYAVFSAQ